MGDEEGELEVGGLRKIAREKKTVQDREGPQGGVSYEPSLLLASLELI